MAAANTLDIKAREAAWWRAWWQRDFSWDGLAVLGLQSYWRSEMGRLIAEPGTARRWTRFHCPFVFADGTPSPKAAWSDDDWVDVERSVRTRLAFATAEAPCRLDGAVLRGLDEGANEAGEAYLWLVAAHAYFQRGVDLRNSSLGLSDFHGAWFGGSADFAGAHQLQPDFAEVSFAQPATVQATPAAPHLTLEQAIAPVVVTPEPAPTNTQDPPTRKRLPWLVILAIAAALAAIAATILAIRP